MRLDHPTLEMRLTADKALQIIDELIAERQRVRQEVEEMFQRADSRIPSNIVPDLRFPEAKLDDETYPRYLIYKGATGVDGDTTMSNTGAGSGTNTMDELHQLYNAGRIRFQDRTSSLAVGVRPPYLVGTALDTDGSSKDMELLPHQREGIGFGKSLYEAGFTWVLSGRRNGAG